MASKWRSSSVSQMLEVLSRFWTKYRRTYDVEKSHIEAIKEVSKGRNITQQTVQDLNWRRASFGSIHQFRGLLEKWVSGDPQPLMDCLRQHTGPQHHGEIRQFFGQEEFKVTGQSSHRGIPRNRSEARGPAAVGETFSFQLQPEVAKNLKVLSLVEEITPADWLANAVPELIEKKYVGWLKEQHLPGQSQS